MANTMTLISSYTVGAGGTTDITLTSIPQTYTDLQLLFSTRDNGGSTVNNILITFNSNTSNIYSEKIVYGFSGSAASASNSSTSRLNFAYSNQAAATSNIFSNNSLYIPNYTSSNNKSICIDTVTENNATTAIQGLSAGLFASSSPITSINLNGNTATFVQYSTVYLYGIKNS